MSRSSTQFNVLALPAASVPPTTVAATNQSDGTPPSARNITGTVVNSSSSTMRGLVSATYAASTASGPGRDARTAIGSGDESTDPRRASTGGCGSTAVTAPSVVVWVPAAELAARGP